MELNKIKKELDKVQNEITDLKNEEYKLNKEYIELLKEKCRENIDRCFKKIQKGKVIAYCLIIDIDSSFYGLEEIAFNQYQYPALWFEYPYNGSKVPFFEDNLFSGAWGKGNDPLAKIKEISYIEIDKVEYLERFKKVNSEWMKKIGNHNRNQ